MKFVCDGLSLSEAVLKVSKACAVRTTAPIMECIKLSAFGEEVTLLATDGELSIRKSVKAEIFEEGETCVPGKLFTDFIGKLSGEEVSIATGEKGVEIKYRDAGTFMQSLPAEEFVRPAKSTLERRVEAEINALYDRLALGLREENARLRETVRRLSEENDLLRRSSRVKKAMQSAQNKEAAEKFLNKIDSACVYHNASTRFTDGFEFGFGAEMGISTQKLHARGPMGLRELTSYKFIIRGNGQVRG